MQTRTVHGAAVLATLAVATVGQASVILFQEGFEADAVDSYLPSRWTMGSTLNTNNRVDGPGTTLTALYQTKPAAEGTHSVWMRDSAVRSMTLKSANAISVTGYSQLQITFSIGQYAGADYEYGAGLDWGKLLVSFDGSPTYSEVVYDTGVALGGSGSWSFASPARIDLAVGTNGVSNKPAQAWYDYTITLDAVTASTMQLKFQASSSTATENYWFDNIVVTAVPEPASLSMLVGGLAFVELRRRRVVQRRHV